MTARASTAIAAAVWIAAAASPAAADGGDRALSVDLGWATFSAPGVATRNQVASSTSPDLGGALGVIYEHGVSTDISLRGEVVGWLFDGGNAAKQGAVSGAGLADVGAVFRFDVLKYVPYAFGAVGALETHGGPLGSNTQLALVVGGGLDILTSRAHSFGVEAELSAFGGNITVFTIGVRGTMRWGFF